MSLSDAYQLLAEIERKRRENKLDYYKPYPYQQKFHNGLGYKTLVPAIQRALQAGNQCITPWTVLQTDRGERQSYEMLGEGEFGVRSWDGSSRCTKQASPLFLKGIEPAFRVYLDNGDTFACSRRHRVLSSLGWISLDLLIRLSGGLRLIGIDEDYQANYVLDDSRYGQRLHLPSDNVQGSIPLLGGAQRFFPDYSSAGEAVHRLSGIHAYPESCHLTTFDDDPTRLAVLFESFSDRSVPLSALCMFCTDPGRDQSERESNLHREGLSAWNNLSEALIPFDCPELVGGNKIIAVLPLGFQPIVDIEVEGTNCYQTAGVIHHNTGKTYSACMEDAFHATGLYPDWFEGTRLNRPITMIVAGKTNDTTKNILQIELFGDPVDENKFGSGTVPKDCIGNITRKAGVPNAYSEVLVKHHDKHGIFNGWSKVFLLSYEMKEKAFMGYRADVCHGDEEPPQEIWSQFLRATLSTNGICYLSYTPEEGITEVVHGFMSNLQEGQLLITAGWDDAPHFTEEMKRQKLAAYPKHEREMRSKGVPRMGSGKVFDVNEDLISINPIPIPDHWPRICGVDFGWDHPFAAVWVAWDRDSDTFYVYDCYREERALMSIQSHAVNSRGDWIPVVWPHDGLIHDKKSGKPLADMYRDEFGINMWHDTFSNPPQTGKEEGTGGNGVEVGLMEMLNRMESGRLKVFSTCTTWFEEFRMYHRKDGQLVKLRDDLMSASRMACMMIRHAQTKTTKFRKQHVPIGIGNW